jgi:hypothetical protein
MSVIYKNRTRSKDNVNNNFVNALDSGTSVINGSSITASNLNANQTLKTDANKVLVSSQISVSDLDFVPLTNPLSAEMTADGFLSTGTNEVKTRFLQDNGSGLYGIEAKSLFKTPLGIRTTSIGNTNIGSDVLLNENIDCNNKQLRDVNGIYTSTLGTQAGLGGDITVVGGPINLNANNITNVNNLETQEIKASDGVSINFQDDLNINNYDLINVNEIKTNSIATNTAPNIVSNNNIDLNTNNLLDVGNMNVSTINNLTAVGGIYSGISDGTTITQAMGTSDLLPVSSVGTLSVPANGFSVGSAFHLVCSGIFPSEDKNDNVEVQLCALLADTSVVVLGSILIDLEDFNSRPSNFELESDFLVRSTGTSGKIAVSFDFTFNKKITEDFKGTRKTNLATLDTTQASTLQLNATISGGNGSSIKSTLAYLRKQY